MEKSKVRREHGPSAGDRGRLGGTMGMTKRKRNAGARDWRGGVTLGERAKKGDDEIGRWEELGRRYLLRSPGCRDEGFVDDSESRCHCDEPRRCDATAVRM